MAKIAKLLPVKRPSRSWSLYTAEGRLDVRALVQLICAWFVWLWQTIVSLFHVRRWRMTGTRRAPYVIDEYGDVTYRPTKREWLRNVLSTDGAIQRRLLNWAKRQIPNHRITDMTSSWSDGIALCALLDKMKPGSCPRYNLLKPLQKLHNCKLALKLVHRNFDIPASVITPEEMAYSRDAKKLRQLLSLLRYYHWYPAYESRPQPPRQDSCWTKGEGLRHGAVNKKAQFVVQTPIEEQTSLIIEIQGPDGQDGFEEITLSSPIRDTCKFFDDDTDGRRASPRHTRDDDQRIDIQYQCIGEGRFAVCYFPKFSGIYHIGIKWHNEDIPGSPFTARIDDLRNSLREGSVAMLNLQELSSGGGEWNYEQCGSTVIRRRSVVMDTGRRLSELAQFSEQKRNSLGSTGSTEPQEPAAAKSRTVTRRRVVRRVVSPNSRELTIDRNEEDSVHERRASFSKLCSFEAAALAVQERHSPSPVRDRAADTIGEDAWKEAYNDVANILPNSADSLLKIADVDVRSPAKLENDDHELQLRCNSCADSGIDLANHGLKLSASSATTVASDGGDTTSPSGWPGPAHTSTPKNHLHDTSQSTGDSYESARESNFEEVHNSSKDTKESYKILQSKSLKKACLYMTGKNVTGTLSLDTVVNDLDNHVANVTEDTHRRELSETGRARLQMSKSLNYEDSSNGYRIKSDRPTRPRSPKRAKSPIPFYGKRRSREDKSENTSQHEHEKSVQRSEKTGQRGSLTRQNDIQSLNLDDHKDVSIQVTSDEIKRELNRKNGLRVRRRKIKVGPYEHDKIIQCSVNPQTSLSECSDRLKSNPSSDLRTSSNDDVITMSTDDVTLPSMTSSIRESTPSVFKNFKFEAGAKEVDDTSVSNSDLHKPVISSKRAISKTRKKRPNFKDRLQMRVYQWLKNQATSADVGGMTLTTVKSRRTECDVMSRRTECDVMSRRTECDVMSRRTECDDRNVEGRSSANSSDRTSAKTTPSEFRIPCECSSYLANKDEYVRIFGELFESELCEDCVAEYKLKSAHYNAGLTNSLIVDKDSSDVEVLVKTRPKLTSNIRPTPGHDEIIDRSAIFLDKKLLIDSRPSVHNAGTKFPSDFKIDLTPKSKPPSDVDIAIASDKNSSRKVTMNDTSPVLDLPLEADDQVERTRMRNEYRRCSDEIRCQEARDYEYPCESKESTLEVQTRTFIVNSDDIKSWSPDNWQELSDTSYRELPTRQNLRKVTGNTHNITHSRTNKCNGPELVKNRTNQTTVPKFQLASSILTPTSDNDRFHDKIRHHGLQPHEPGGGVIDNDIHQHDINRYYECHNSARDKNAVKERPLNCGCSSCYENHPITLPYKKDFCSPPCTFPVRDPALNGHDHNSTAPIKQFTNDSDSSVICQTAELNRIFSRLESNVRKIDVSCHGSDLKQSAAGDTAQSKDIISDRRSDRLIVKSAEKSSSPGNHDTAAETVKTQPSCFTDNPSNMTYTNENTTHNDTALRKSMSSLPFLGSPQHGDSLQPCCQRCSSRSSVGTQFLEELEEYARKATLMKDFEPPNPGACEASGVGLNSGLTGIRNNFQVRTKHAGHGTLAVSIHGPSPHCVTEVSTLYTGDCMYEIFYRASKPGYYIISIKWSDVKIPNSPFICKLQ